MPRASMPIYQTYMYLTHLDGHTSEPRSLHVKFVYGLKYLNGQVVD